MYSLAPAYYIVDAPAGYGKTELLKELAKRFRNEDWYSAYVEVMETDTIEELTIMLAEKLGVTLPTWTGLSWGDRLAAALLNQWENDANQKNSQKGIVLFIDLNTRTPGSLLDELLQTFIPDIEENLRSLELFQSSHNRFRVIVAGRYLARHRSIQETKLLFKIISLGPFDDMVIRASIAKYLPLHRGDEMWQLGAHLLYATGGHPGCMARVLERYKNIRMQSDRFLSKNSEFIWERITKPVTRLIYDEIGSSLPQQCPILDWFSVFRYLDLEVLRRIIELDHRFSGLDEFDLEEQLLGTYLVTRKYDGVSDDIMRRLLTIRLRHESGMFAERVAQAEEICMQRLQDPSSSPNIWIIETLFQTLQKHANQICDRTERAEIRSGFMKNDVPKVLQMFNQKRDLPPKALQREGARLVEDFSRDWEFRFTVNYYLRESQYNEAPYQELLMVVRNFFTLPAISRVTYDN